MPSRGDLLLPFWRQRQRTEAPDRVVPQVGEPQGAVGPGGDPTRFAREGDGVVSDGPGGGDLTDRVVAFVGEPQGPVGPGGDPLRAADARAGVVGDHPGGGDPPDRVVPAVGEPQGPSG